jgi:hypothetical protein
MSSRATGLTGLRQICAKRVCLKPRACGASPCNDLRVHQLAGFRLERVRSACLALGVAVLLAPGLRPQAVGAQALGAVRASRQSHVCRVPRLTSLVLAVARKRAAKAGCALRLAGAHVEAPDVQTIRIQVPSAGRHGRFVTVWLNPVCSGSGAEGPGISEPSITTGPTELISGLYVVGGPLRRWSEPRCTPRPGEPGAGTVTVRDPANGMVVASQTVTRGHLATIPLAPGTYSIQGTFGNATINEHPGESFPTTVQILPGQTVRQDVFLNVP